MVDAEAIGGPVTAGQVGAFLALKKRINLKDKGL